MTSNRIQKHPIQRRGTIDRVFTGFLLLFAAIVVYFYAAALHLLT